MQTEAIQKRNQHSKDPKATSYQTDYYQRERERLYSVLPNSKSFPWLEKMIRATSASHSTESS